MKKLFFFLIFICFTGILNAQTSSNSVNAKTNRLPTNEEVVKYFKDTEYPYPMNNYYKSFIHEFDSYITAPKLDLEQSESFKQLCNLFLKVPSAEELEPIIIDKIHFKLFRDDFTYWSIKCKLDNKEHSFLITGAGRIIHRSDNCDGCENIRTKRTQFKKQITEFIEYLKEKYGNLENVHNKLNIPYDVIKRKQLIEQARADSIRAVEIEVEKANQIRKKKRTDSISARIDSLKNTYKLVKYKGSVPGYVIEAGKNKIEIDNLEQWGIMTSLEKIGRIFIYETSDSIFVSTYPDFFLNNDERKQYNYGYISDNFSGLIKNSHQHEVYMFPKTQKIRIKEKFVKNLTEAEKFMSGKNFIQYNSKIYEFKPQKK